MSRVESILRWIRGPRVLDIGCAGSVPQPGSPNWLHGAIRREFDSVVGIDVSEVQVQELSELGFRDVYVASAEDYEFDRRFDSIVAGELIEHLANPGLFLKTSRNHLDAGGRLVLTTPYPFSLLYILYSLTKFPRTCPNPEHTCWFCPSTLTELAERNGFRVEHWQLIEDYITESSSRSYRAFMAALPLARRILPQRLVHNSMLFVLEPSP